MERTKDYYKITTRIYQYKKRYANEFPYNENVKEMLKEKSPKEVYYTLKVRSEYVE